MNLDTSNRPTNMLVMLCKCKTKKKSGVCFEKETYFRFLLQVCDEIRINIPDLGRVYGHRQKLNRTVGTTAIPQWPKIENSIWNLFLGKQDIFQSLLGQLMSEICMIHLKNQVQVSSHYWQFTVEDSEIIFGFAALSGYNFQVAILIMDHSVYIDCKGVQNWSYFDTTFRYSKT